MVWNTLENVRNNFYSLHLPFGEWVAITNIFFDGKCTCATLVSSYENEYRLLNRLIKYLRVAWISMKKKESSVKSPASDVEDFHYISSCSNPTGSCNCKLVRLVLLLLWYYLLIICCLFWLENKVQGKKLASGHKKYTYINFWMVTEMPVLIHDSKYYEPLVEKEILVEQSFKAVELGNWKICNKQLVKLILSIIQQYGYFI